VRLHRGGSLGEERVHDLARVVNHAVPQHLDEARLGIDFDDARSDAFGHDGYALKRPCFSGW